MDRYPQKPWDLRRPSCTLCDNRAMYAWYPMAEIEVTPATEDEPASMYLGGIDEGTDAICLTCDVHDEAAGSDVTGLPVRYSIAEWFRIDTPWRHIWDWWNVDAYDVPEPGEVRRMLPLRWGWSTDFDWDRDPLAVSGVALTKRAAIRAQSQAEAELSS